ncbi:MFS transporter [Brevibacterium album]|uniref:MFS transporter n=1 Tax=Brevibacterium album TaxID=417948 RepID=UPI000423869F|nr:MFS transporter [Brevibacterium album]
MKPFHHVVANTALANMTTSYLWFALTFWVYLETRNVAVSAVIGAGYMGLVSVFSLVFGMIVDHNRKKRVMLLAAVITLLAYLLACGVWLVSDHGALVSLTSPSFWLFAMIILGGSVVEQMRNIALSTTVTLLVPEGERDKANGLVGMVQGLAFFITSVFSGLSIGYLGMGPTLGIATALTAVALIHLLPIRIPEERIVTAAEVQEAIAAEAGGEEGMGEDTGAGAEGHAGAGTAVGTGADTGASAAGRTEASAAVGGGAEAGSPEDGSAGAIGGAGAAALGERAAASAEGTAALGEAETAAGRKGAMGESASAVPVPAPLTASEATAAPLPGPAAAPGRVSKLDLAGSIRTIRAIPGLTALILFACFNNFIGGTFMALMDPYGLELFSPQLWGIVLGVTSLGFVVGGGIVARTGLGANPVRTLLFVNLLVAGIGMGFTIREWWWLFAVGMFVFMALMPAAEASEQTILQRVVPFHRQGRVFGLAQSVETAASPVSAFFVGIIAQQTVIPWVDSEAGREALGWLLGEGSARGMALMFMGAGLIMLLVVLLAFVSPQYRGLSAYYGSTRQDLTEAGAQGERVAEAGGGAGAGAQPGTGAESAPEAGLGGEPGRGHGVDRSG